MNAFNPVELCRTGLIGKSTENADSSVMNAPIVCFYFSAHWCPPCRGFTPELAAWYEDVKNEGVQVVFVTCDRSDEEFRNYFAEMPWYALPHGDARIGTLKTEMGCQGIPYLVVYKQDGTLVTKNGRSDVTSNPTGCVANWLK
jgi:nucleoredoxin